MKVAFNHPKTKVGEVVAVIPSYAPRNPYVLAFLDDFYEEIELRLGSTTIWPEESFLVLVNGSCSACRKQLYHIPKSDTHDPSKGFAQD